MFEALESGLWMRPGYGVSIGGYGIPVQADDKGLLFDDDFTFDHLAIVHKPAYKRANIEEMKKVRLSRQAKKLLRPDMVDNMADLVLMTHNKNNNP